MPSPSSSNIATEASVNGKESVGPTDKDAMDLWNIIHSSGKYRYTISQRNRTLFHPCLPQPTAEEERVSLLRYNRQPAASTRSNLKGESDTCDYTMSSDLIVCEECSTDTISVEDNSKTNNKSAANAQLRARVSAALESANINPYMNFDDHNSRDDEEHADSPTSTLNFPHEMTRPVGMMPTAKTIGESQSYPSGKAQRSEMHKHSASHTFVVCADSQIGMTSQNKEWETELEYCRDAIHAINEISPRPAFVSVCGDLVDMEYTFFANEETGLTKKECDEIQNKQNSDFKRVWSTLDDRIPLVCICGNHDVGNRPTRESIEKFKNAFGDDYLAFWSNGSYNIVLNNVLFSEPSGAIDLFNDQVSWLEERLEYANSHNANQIFVFAHHPWFLYNEDETDEDLTGGSAFPVEWGSSDKKFLDSYFSIRKEYRDIALSLFKKYNVSAAFSGHFHQNLVSKTSFGMDMIITAPLSLVFESTGKPRSQIEMEKNARGIRIVEVIDGSFTHNFEAI